MVDKPFGEYGCYVDECEGEECVFDGEGGSRIDSCDVAIELTKASKGRNDCVYWKPIQQKQILPSHTCPKCGHQFE